MLRVFGVSANLKALKNSGILYVRFVLPERHCSYLFFFGWVTFHFQEITYAKKNTPLGKTECFLHKIMQYLEDEANCS